MFVDSVAIGVDGSHAPANLYPLGLGQRYGVYGSDDRAIAVCVSGQGAFVSRVQRPVFCQPASRPRLYRHAVAYGPCGAPVMVSSPPTLVYAAPELNLIAF